MRLDSGRHNRPPVGAGLVPVQGATPNDSGQAQAPPRSGRPRGSPQRPRTASRPSEDPCTVEPFARSPPPVAGLEPGAPGLRSPNPAPRSPMPDPRSPVPGARIPLPGPLAFVLATGPRAAIHPSSVWERMAHPLPLALSDKDLHERRFVAVTPLDARRCALALPLALSDKDLYERRSVLVSPLATRAMGQGCPKPLTPQGVWDNASQGLSHWPCQIRTYMNGTPTRSHWPCQIRSYMNEASGCGTPHWLCDRPRVKRSTGAWARRGGPLLGPPGASRMTRVPLWRGRTTSPTTRIYTYGTARAGRPAGCRMQTVDAPLREGVSSTLGQNPRATLLPLRGRLVVKDASFPRRL